MLKQLIAASLATAISLTGFAAPPPKEPEAAKLKRLWGESADADKDCTFALDEDKLKLTVPGKNHLFRASAHNGGQGQADNAPRTARTVTGDFKLSVEFAQTQPAKGAVAAGSFAGAGLYVAGGDSCYSIARHHSTVADGTVDATQFRLMGKSKNSSSASGRIARKDEADKPITVRVVREGNRITSTFSTDGKVWKALWTYEGAFATEVTVGVFAENTGAKGYEAVFDGLKFDTGEKK